MMNTHHSDGVMKLTYTELIYIKEENLTGSGRGAVPQREEGPPTHLAKGESPVPRGMPEEQKRSSAVEQMTERER